ncbi:MAG TPA: AAA family ATPase [Steroidobacteraceae bacterium]|nr:AAA family ATPase [Steroidobacteraceae bacterium]
MSIHKLQPERGTGDGAREDPVAAIQVSLTSELYDLAGAVVRARAIRAIDLETRSLPIYRVLRWSVSRKVNDLFDEIACDPHFNAQRTDAGNVLLSAPGLFVAATGHDKSSYCSSVFQLWADSRARAEEAEALLRQLSGELRPREKSFVVDWQFMAANALRSSSFEEIVTEELLDEAYPSLPGGVQVFVEGFLASSDAVLILLGPPGGGKTRLVREILAAISHRKGENAEIMYTTDKRAIANDEMFVEFITCAHDALVIEDTDHLLKARTSGNEDMHRFLSIADGIARAQGRKVIFTTNLPNVSDIDPALTRPGRCHAVVALRSLTLAEAQRLAGRICGSVERTATACARLESEGAKHYSVAQVYRACG